VADEVTDIGSDAHVDEQLLGLHYMDALEPAESDVIHQHLLACPECQAKADEVVDVVAALALLGTDETEPATPAPAAAPVAVPTPPHVATVRPGADRAGRGRGSSRPSSGRGSSRPGERRPGRTANLVRAGSLLALVLVLAGLGLATLVGSPQATPTPVVTAAAVATDGTTGASASVAVAGDGDDGVTVRATVSGLRDGVTYVLYAVTSDGTTREVTRWTGTTAVQDVTGGLAVRLGDLSFFAVSELGGGPVVTVYLPGVAVAPTR
jgi:hypothetical protein